MSVESVYDHWNNNQEFSESEKDFSIAIEGEVHVIPMSFYAGYQAGKAEAEKAKTFIVENGEFR